MPNNESTLTLKLKVNDDGSIVLDRFTGKLSEIPKQLDKVNSSLVSMKWDAFTNLIQKGASALEKLWEVAQRGAEIVKIETAYKNMTQSIGIAGGTMLKQMQDATQGMVSNTELMRQATRMLNEELNPKNIIMVADAARTLSNVAGISTTQAFDQLGESIIRLNSRGLREFGISTQALKEHEEALARSLGGTAENLTDQGVRLAYLQAVWEATQKARKHGVDEMGNEAKQIEQWATSMKNLGDAFAKVGIGLVAGIVTVIEGWGAIILMVGAGIQKLVELMFRGIGLIASIPLVKKLVPGLEGGANNLADFMKASASSGFDMALNMGKLAGKSLSLTGQAFGGAATAFGGLGSEVGPAPTTQKPGREPGVNYLKPESLKDLSEALEEEWKRRIAADQDSLAKELLVIQEGLDKQLEANRKSLDTLEIDHTKGLMSETQYIHKKYELIGKGLQEELETINKQQTAFKTNYEKETADTKDYFKQKEALYKGNRSMIETIEKEKDVALLNLDKKYTDESTRLAKEGSKKQIEIGKNATEEMVKQYENIEKQISHPLQQVGDDIATAFNGILDGSKKAGQAFKEMGLSIIKMLEQMILKQILFNDVQGKYQSSSTGEGGIMGFLGSAIHGILGMAEGGITGPLLSHYPIRRYAYGGIATSPQVGIFGEGGGSGEAFVPLKNGKIPVEQSSQGGGDTHIFINAVDAKSFEDMITRNPSGIMKVVNKDRRLNGTMRQGNK